MQRIFYCLYQILLYCLLPFLLLRLFLRGFKQPYYRTRWRERLGYQLPNIPDNVIWIHAVSVGEVIATRFLVEKLQQQHPESTILMTTMTPTGSQQVKKLFQDRVSHCYIPYDCTGAVKRFLNHAKPRIAIIMETEIWPTLYAQTKHRHIPMILANARLSPRSFIGYRKLRFLIKPVLQNVTLISAQTQDDKNRFIALGAQSSRVMVSGSIKFDSTPPNELIQAGKALRAQWGTRPVWIAASTHLEEEAIVLAAYKAVQAKIPDVLCVIVPRHPERFHAVWEQCQKQDLRVARRSQNEIVAAQTQVYLGDTLGELYLFYATADVAFVGGSFSHTGGHNILEPAALQLPIVIGPNMFNFAQITQLFLAAHACIQLQSSDKLAHTVIDLLQHRERCEMLGHNAAAVVKQHQGALERLMEEIGGLVPL